MKKQTQSSFLLAAATLIATSAFAVPAKDTSAPTQVDLTFRTLRTWDVHLPAEAFAPIGKTIPFAAAGEAGLKVAIEEGTLRIDRNGDGTLDGRVETPSEDKKSQLVVFRLNEGTEDESSYAIRVQNKGRWSYAPAGAMEGRAGNTRFMIFDQNGNGRFDDYGVDAMIVGRGKTASFLSNSIHIDGELHQLTMSADGQTAQLAAFSGEMGKLDLGKQLSTKAKMRSVIVNSEDGKHSFELSRALTAEGGLNVPTGNYILHSAQVVLGKSHATMSTGNSKPISVDAGGTSTLSWGGPVNAKFRYRRGGDELQIAPGDILYYGSAGEVYSNFMPLGSSPKFAVKEKATGKVLVNAVFPGNC
ncbi:MAG: hypothetical protein P1V35_02310 [Planctomycetota bacterium]|nr:hypothetical protein [Planctomycetota bacterium]